MHMLNAALMSAEQPPLDKRCDIVDAWHHHVGRIGAGADDGDLKLLAGCHQSAIPAPSVDVDHRNRHYGGLNEGWEAGAGHVSDAAKTNPADALAILSAATATMVLVSVSRPRLPFSTPPHRSRPPPLLRRARLVRGGQSPA